MDKIEKFVDNLVKELRVIRQPSVHVQHRDNHQINHQNNRNNNHNNHQINQINVVRRELQAVARHETVSLDKINEEGIRAHNEYRRRHNVGPLKYSKALSDYAQNWAEYLARNNQFKHSNCGSRGYGENLAMVYGRKVTGELISKMWYDEVVDYDFKTGDRKKTSPSSKQIGHFTQLVWKGTTEVGWGIATASNGYVYVVANYSPPGNIMGYFTSNVLP